MQIASLVLICGFPLLVLLAVGLATLWAEVGGKRRPAPDEPDEPKEIDRLDGRRGTGRQPADEAEEAEEAVDDEESDRIATKPSVPPKRRPPDDEDDDEDADEESDDLPPWERPGGVRRDCEPDRGSLLLWLGRFSLWPIALTALIGALGVVVLLVVIPLAITVLVMASGDRRKMRDGTMDPAGERLTRKAARYAKAALVTIVVLVLGVGVLVTAMIALSYSGNTDF